ncbi:hypothetical protein [Enterobacter cloacae]|uniref:hypothetical protein n=1 Tax=Enterobacter cloacae TaxID=550 RepID=UPI0034D23755
MAKAKWHRLPAFTIPLFQSAHVYLATTREQFQHADKFLGGSGDERPFNSGLASNYENTDTGERCYLIGVFDNQIPAQTSLLLVLLFVTAVPLLQ